jgi:hypothetical protein
MSKKARRITAYIYLPAYLVDCMLFPALLVLRPIGWIPAGFPSIGDSRNRMVMRHSSFGLLEGPP